MDIYIEQTDKFVWEMYSACYDDNKIWFTSKWYNYLFCADIKTKKIEIISKVPGDPLISYRRHSRFFKYKESLILIPELSKSVVIYNMVRGSFDEIMIPIEVMPKTIYQNVGISKNKLYLIECTSKQLVEIDLDKKNICGYYKIDYIRDEDVTGRNPALVDGKIYIPIKTKKEIIVYDTKEHIFRECHIDNNVNGYEAVRYDGMYFWLIGVNEGIAKWDGHSSEVFILRAIPRDIKVFEWEEELEQWYPLADRGIYNYFFCWDSFFDGKYIWVIPTLSDSVLYINKNDGIINSIRFLDEYETCRSIKQIGREAIKFSLLGIEEERYIRLISYKNRVIYCIDNTTMQYTIEKWELEETAKKIVVNDYWSAEVCENSQIGIAELTDYLFCDVKERIAKGDEVNVGQEIYKALSV